MCFKPCINPGRFCNVIASNQHWDSSDGDFDLIAIGVKDDTFVIAISG